MYFELWDSLQESGPSAAVVERYKSERKELKKEIVALKRKLVSIDNIVKKSRKK